MTSEKKFLALRAMFGTNTQVSSNVCFLPVTLNTGDSSDDIPSAGGPTVTAEQVFIATVSGNTCVLRNMSHIHHGRSSSSSGDGSDGSVAAGSTAASGGDIFISAGSSCRRITCVKVFQDRKYFAIGCSRSPGSPSASGGLAPMPVPGSSMDPDASSGGAADPEHPFFQIYDVGDFRLCRTVSMADSPVGSGEILCIDRSKDNKIMIVQGGAPDYRLAVWLFSNATRPKKPIGVLRVFSHAATRKAAAAAAATGQSGSGAIPSRVSQRFGISPEGFSAAGTGTGTESSSVGGSAVDCVYQSSISPNGRMICVTGEGLFRLYRIEDSNGYKIVTVRRELQVPPTENRSFLSHMWVDNSGFRLIVGNAAGMLYVVDEGDFRCVLASSPQNHLSINCIVPYENAFLIGGEDGHLTAFEKTDDQKLYKKVNFVKLPNEGDRFQPEEQTITSMDYDAANNNIVCSTSSGRMFTVQMTGWVHLRDAEVTCLSPFHTSRITGVDTAVKKPFVATCGEDKTVRIYDYHTGTVEVLRRFEIEALSLSLHPTGYYLLVGFTDKLRFFKILGNEIREEISFAIRSCSQVKFSNGGQYFAAVHGTAVHIYSTYTHQHLYSLRNAHTAKVTSIFWNQDDTKLTSVDAVGTVVEFMLKNETKIWDHTMPDTYLFDVVGNPKTTFVVGRDSKMHVFMEQVHLNEYALPRQYGGRRDDVGTSLTALAVSPYSKLLFAGREDGSVWVYDQGGVQQYIDVHFCHSAPITHLRTTHRGQMLVSVAMDGSMALYEVWEKDHDRLSDDELSSSSSSELARRRRRRRVAFVNEDWDDEILIVNSDLQAKMDLIREFEVKCRDLQTGNQYTQIQKQADHDAKMKLEHEEYQREHKKKAALIEQLEREIKAKQSKYEIQRRKKKEKHRKEVSELDYQCHEQIASTLNKLKNVELSKQAELRRLVEKGDEEDYVNEEDKRRLVDEGKEEGKKLREEIAQLHTKKQKAQGDHDLFLRLLKEQQKQDIERVVEESERRLRKEQLEFDRLTKESRRRVSSEREYDEERQALQQKIDKKQRELQGKIAELVQRNHETESIKKENEEREKTIEQKKRRIEELTKQNKELNKFRFVLNYKIDTLQNEINPNRDTIASMERDITKYNRELERYRQDRDGFRHEIRDLDRKINGNVLELKKLRGRFSDADSFKTRMRQDIHKVYEHIRDEKMLKQKVVNFYHTFAAPELTGRKRRIDFDLQRENDRRRTHLERSVDSLKRKLVKATKTSKQGTMRIMHENVLLINEINNLRKELRFLNRRLHGRNAAAVTRGRGLPGEALRRPSLAGADLDIREASRQLDMQKLHIAALRNRVEQLERQRRLSRRGYSSSRGSGRSTASGTGL